MDTLTFMSRLVNLPAAEKMRALFSWNFFGANRIACPMEDERMDHNESTLSREDLKYIRNLIAEGLARMLVEKVTKSSVSAVDKSEPERYSLLPN